MPAVPARAHPTVSNASFWQKPFARDVLPLITSLALHLGIVALAVVTYRAVHVIVEVSRVPAVIPEYAAPLTGDGIPQFRGLDDDPTRRAARDKLPDVPDAATGLGKRPSVLMSLTASGGAVERDLDDAIALGLSSNFGSPRGTLGLDKGEGTSGGTEGGPGVAPFGVGGGGGNVEFFIPGGPIGRVVFVCDASGSMLDKFDALRLQLRKAVDRLKSGQAFDIFFFAGDRCLALDPQLLLAVPQAKRKAFEFLDGVAPHGTSDPIPALKAAFATGPQLIYLLTDGDFPNNSEVLNTLRKLNKDRKVKINSIAFMDRGEAYEKLLQRIADENGGTFKFVAEQELQP
jgi:hypothetical protein